MTRLCVTLVCALVCTASVHAATPSHTVRLPGNGIPVIATVNGTTLLCALWPFKNSANVIMECEPISQAPAKKPAKKKAAKHGSLKS